MNRGSNRSSRRARVSPPGGTRLAENRLVSKLVIGKMQCVSRSWKSACALSAVAISAGLTGCSSGPNRSAVFSSSAILHSTQPPSVTPSNAATPRAVPVVTQEVIAPLPVVIAAPVTAVPPTVVQTPAGPGVRAEVLNPVKAWPPGWTNAWIPLESWGRFSGLGKPALLTTNARAPNPAFQFRSTNGSTLTVKIGSRVAWCDGLECWLGYAPQIIKGVPYIHSIDAQKSFQPLLNSGSGVWRVGFGNSAPSDSGGSTQESKRKAHVVVIDPGHGGKDSGTTNCVTGEHEKQYTLDWARRLESLLTLNGWNVVLTRTNDSELSLSERVAVADRVNADLFLSLHFNSGTPNPNLAGLETYCLTPVGMPSNLLRAYEDNPLQAYPNNAFDEENLQYAVNLHRVLLNATNASDRGVRRARFMSVLRGQKRPAVLIEGGYLSNAKEARNIASAAYRQTMAEAVAKALE